MHYGFSTLNHHNCKRCVEPGEHLKKCKRCVEPFQIVLLLFVYAGYWMEKRSYVQVSGGYVAGV
uniref:Uncharacterized protein n=1 Tax=Candidatus Methanogaster sp. ANME-2c ERB4 TaxID=2759911 RepID=A0A7G9YQH7_9EURY|nr:hypothetical protein MIKCHCCC_00001 [Methanosarcinales archaeon ANME-2c ERB4]